MSTDNKKERDLKEYIVKLNDRNIQRQRETGFTLYAILGTIVYLIFYLIDHLGIPIQILQERDALLVSVFFVNFLFITYFFVIAFIAPIRNQTFTKIFPNQRQLSIEVEDYPVFLGFILIGFLNLWLIRFEISIQEKILSFVFGGLAILNLLSPFIIDQVIIFRNKRKRKKGQSVEEFKFDAFNKQINRSIVVGSLIYGLILSLFLGFVLNSSLTTIGTDLIEAKQIFKYLLILFGLTLLVKIAIDIRMDQNRHDRLEDFERRIFFDNISNSEIAEVFENDFDGISFSRWIEGKQTEIKLFFEVIHKSFLEQDQLLTEIDQIRKEEFPFEYTGRMQIIVNNQSELLSKASDFVQKFSNTISNLRNFSALNNFELQQLNVVNNYLNQNIQTFNNLYANLVNQINNRQSI